VKYEVQEVRHRGVPAFRQSLDVLYEVKTEKECSGDHAEQSARLSVYDRLSDFCNIQQKKIFTKELFNCEFRENRLNYIRTV
jgi:hypothetical protein